MPELPRGTVTFAFTDVEGSTALLKRLGDGYGDVISAHRRLVRDEFAARGGVEIDTQGDAFFFAFPRARDAVAAAAALQRAHTGHRWPHDAIVRVRVGLHTGEPTVADEGYLGLDVVRAARLCGACSGGQVLLSETTRALTGSTLPAGVKVHPLGERQLRDMDEPERVFELDIEGVAVTNDGGTASPAVAGGSAGHPSRADRKKRQKDWERDFERRAEEFAQRTAEGVLSAMERRLGSLFESGRDSGPAEPEAQGVDAIAEHADELARRVAGDIARARGPEHDGPDG